MLPCAPMLSALSHWLGSCNYATGSGRHAVADKQNEIPEANASGIAVAPTGVDPVTFRFSVERSTN